MRMNLRACGRVGRGRAVNIVKFSCQVPGEHAGILLFLVGKSDFHDGVQVLLYGNAISLSEVRISAKGKRFPCWDFAFP